MSDKRVICLLTFFLVFLGTASAQFYPASASETGVSVTGEAEVQVVPDQVIITFGIETKDSELPRAKDLNDKRMKAVIATLKEAGIEQKDLLTDFFHVQPDYDYNQRLEPKSYAVRKSLVVTLQDVQKFESIVSRALEAGVNVIHGIDFRTTDLRKHRDSARALAVRAAREKAQALAKELGQSIGKPLRIIEERGGSWSYYSHGWWGRGAHSSMSQNIVQSVGAAGNDVEAIAPGKIKVTASVAVTFELN